MQEIEATTAQIEGWIDAIERGVVGQVNRLSANDVAEKLAEFEGVWEMIGPMEQTQLLTSILKTITYYQRDRIEISFHDVARSLDTLSGQC